MIRVHERASGNPVLLNPRHIVAVTQLAGGGSLLQTDRVAHVVPGPPQQGGIVKYVYQAQEVKESQQDVAQLIEEAGS